MTNVKMLISIPMGQLHYVGAGYFRSEEIKLWHFNSYFAYENKS